LSKNRLEYSIISMRSHKQATTRIIIEAGFIQFVDFATRGGNISDVILADDDQIITTVGADVPIGYSDH